MGNAQALQTRVSGSRRLKLNARRLESRNRRAAAGIICASVSLGIGLRDNKKDKV